MEVHTGHIGNETLASRTARALAQLSLAAEAGDHLGAEDDLLNRLGVSRPTLRQAAKIVEGDRLISVRRGTKGGYFAERPDARDAIQSLARFLRLKGATLSDVIHAVRPVSEEAVAAAARDRTDADVERMEQFVSVLNERDTAREMIAAELEMSRLVAGVGGNPVVELIMEIGFSFGRDENSDLYADAGRRQQMRDMQRKICIAIMDGDAEIARIMMRRRSEQFDAWLAPASHVPTNGL